MASGDEVLVAAGVHGPHTPRHGLDRNPLLCSYSFTMALASARSILVAPSPPEHLVVTGRGVPRGGWSQAACGAAPLLLPVGHRCLTALLVAQTMAPMRGADITLNG